MAKVDVLRGGSGKWMVFKKEEGVRSCGRYAIPLACGKVRGDWDTQFQDSLRREAFQFSGVSDRFLRGGTILFGVEIPDVVYNTLVRERESNLDQLTARELIELFDRAEHDNAMLE